MKACRGGAQTPPGNVAVRACVSVDMCVWKSVCSEAAKSSLNWVVSAACQDFPVELWTMMYLSICHLHEMGGGIASCLCSVFRSGSADFK